MLGASAGVSFGAAARRFDRWLLTASGVVTVIVFVIVAVVAGASYPGMGPAFALALAITSVSVAAYSERDHPALRGEPYWRRVVLVTFHQRALRPVSPGGAGCGELSAVSDDTD